MKTAVAIALTVFLLILFGVQAPDSHGEAKAPQYDIIIRNGRVVDGTGRPAFRNDVAIAGDRIVAMGDLRNVPAKRVIDARGQIVAPGFIDMLGQSEQFVLIDPSVGSSLRRLVRPLDAMEE